MKTLKGMGLAALRLFSLVMMLGGVLGSVMALLGAILLTGWGGWRPVSVMMILSAILTPLCGVTSAAFLSEWAEERRRGMPFLREERIDFLRACAAAAVALMMPLAWMAPSAQWMAGILSALDLAGIFLAMTFYGIPFRRRKRGDSDDTH